MAISSSKKFLRTMAQPFEQSTKSLWGIEQVLQKQRLENGEIDDMDMEEGEAEDDMYGGIDDEDLAAMEFQVI